MLIADSGLVVVGRDIYAKIRAKLTRVYCSGKSKAGQLLNLTS